MRHRSFGLACALLLGSAGCEGVLGDAAAGPRGGPPRGPGPDPGACVEAPIPAPQPMRRISSEQYARVVHDLVPGALGDALLARSTFPATIIERGFSTDAVANTVSTAESHAIEDSAQAMATHILESADTAIPELTAGCVTSGFSDGELDACLPGFLSDFGERAYRRPLTEGERGIATRLYQSLRASQGSRAGFAAVMQLFLQSPALLYRVERGAGVDEDGALRLSSHEVAARLSFFLRGSLPDGSLLEAARADRLSDPAEVETQARRLAAEASFVEVLSEFHRDWLHSYRIARDERDHPLFSPAVQSALASEVRSFTEMVLVTGDGRFETLMSASRFPVAPELAALYGVSGGGGALDVPNRRGILSLASVMASHARDHESLPVNRGAFVREAVLCGGTLTLPPGIDVAAETASTAHLPTARERLASLTERDDCRGCHLQINPIGLGLENYDQLGAWRETEHDATIDPSGSYAFGAVTVEFSSPEELLGAIASSPLARSCYATQMYRWAMGRPETEADRCTLSRLQQRFAESDGDIRELAVAIATSRPFLTRGPVEE